MKHKLGLVLSGGGVKGVAHIGALRALAENNIQPTCISGTSAGAIIGALYAYGKSADEIFEIFENSHLFSLSRFAFGKPGFIDIEKLDAIWFNGGFANTNGNEYENECYSMLFNSFLNGKKSNNTGRVYGEFEISKLAVLQEARNQGLKIPATLITGSKEKLLNQIRRDWISAHQAPDCVSAALRPAKWQTNRPETAVSGTTPSTSAGVDAGDKP